MSKFSFSDEFYISSSIRTVAEHIKAVGKRPNPHQADIMPKTKETIPMYGLEVPSIILGNVISASVMYGT